MAAADLSGVDAKIGWAKCHLAALKEAIDDTLDAHPCQLVGQMDRETGAYVFTVHNLPAMDPTWGLRVGDVVHNLRCALDHLAWQLVILENKKPNRNTQFPIRRYPRVNEKAEQLQVKLEPAVSNSAILDALESVQPYADPWKAGEHPLWRLNRLDIIDKHHVLLVVRAALNVGGMSWGWWGEHPPPGVIVNVSPLEEGDWVARFDVKGREPPPGWRPHADISIVLNEGEMIDLASAPIVRVLDMLVRWVEEEVVNWRFRPLFPAAAQSG